MKTCEKCNLSYEDDKKFCKECGNPLTLLNQIEPNEAARITKIIFGGIFIVIGLTFFLSNCYGLFIWKFQPEKLLMEMQQKLVAQGISKEQADHMTKAIALKETVFALIGVLIGAGIAAGGYILFKKGKKK